MKFQAPVPISVLTNAFPDLIIRGQIEHIHGAAIVPFAESPDLVYADTEQWLTRALKSSAAAIVTTPALAQSNDIGAGNTKALLLHVDPLGVFGFVLNAAGVESEPRVPEKCADYNIYRGCSISPDAWVASDVVVGQGSIIAPHAYVGSKVVIGKNCVVQSGSKLIWNVTLEDNVVVQSNCVIGGSPFFFRKESSGWIRPLPRLGGVRLGEGVSVGSGTCIDRGVLEDTVIGQHTVIDNLVQVGHGTKIGSHVIVAAHAAIAGHVTIGDRVRIMGQVGITPNVSISSDTTILGRTVVSRSISAPGKYVGSRGRSIEAESRRGAALSGLISIAPSLNEIFSHSRGGLTDALKNLVEAQFGVEKIRIQMQSSFVDDFGADSLATVEFRIAVEKEFNVELPDDYEERIHTFRDIVTEVAHLKGLAIS